MIYLSAKNTMLQKTNLKSKMRFDLDPAIQDKSFYILLQSNLRTN